MQSAAGRLLRIVAGLALTGVGWFVVQGTWGVVLAIVGLIPLIAGLAGVCLFAPLFGLTLCGEHRVRSAADVVHTIFSRE
jgi:hypothetical protein